MRRICALFAALAAAFLFLLAGCGPKETVMPAPSPSEVVTPTPTATPTSTPTPTPTPTPEPTEEPKELWGFPIDETHDAFEVPTGGKLGTVLVTVERGEENTESELGGYRQTIAVWEKSDLENPIQTFEIEDGGFINAHHGNLMDVNFDGYMDFTYPDVWFATNMREELYVWDEGQGKFLYGGSFVGHGLYADEEQQVVYNYIHGSAASGVHEVYRWEKDEMVCVREIELCYPDWVESQDLVVRDRIDGELVEVYRKTFGPPEENSPIYDESEKWQDLNYHGEA